ncbi:helix-turn-helix transcriptional regulator [Streptomyces sp. NPDC093252]|uniref:helix-turn-helix domain-containing protein n=1 Tax=Streptomyces sp. NPDC093252 TaxID=3154980 RepID=UPI00343A7131
MSKGTRGMRLNEERTGWEFFGNELKKRREAAGLTQGELGSRVFVSGSYIGQIEAAMRKPQLDLAERIDIELRTEGLFARMCRDLIEAVPVPDDEDESPLPSYFSGVAVLESEALSIAEYAPSIVPGVLQTEQYHRALRAPFLPLSPARNGGDEVRRRQERAALLTRPTRPLLWVVLQETVLRVAVGGRAVMAGQLRHIADLMESGRIGVQVLPFSEGAVAVTGGMFSVMTFEDAPDVAYSEGQHSGRLLDDPVLVVRYQQTFALLRAAAMSPGGSLTMIATAAESYT